MPKEKYNTMDDKDTSKKGKEDGESEGEDQEDTSKKGDDDMEEEK